MGAQKRQFYGLWRERLTVVADAATEVVMTEPVPPGETWYIQRVVVNDSTTAAADVEVGIWSGAYNHVLAVQANVGADTWCPLVLETWLREGEQLCFDWSSVVAADVLEMHLSGSKHYLSGK